MIRRYILFVAALFLGVSIAVILNLFPTAISVTLAAEMWEGIWAQAKEECLDKEGPNSRTLINLSNREKGRLRPIFDQYEHHCQIDRMRTSASHIILSNTCFEFWENFDNKKNGARETVLITARDWMSISINGKQYVRCSE